MCDVLRQEALRRGNWSNQRGDAIMMKLKRAGYTGTQRFPVGSSIAKALENSDEEEDAVPKVITVIDTEGQGKVGPVQRRRVRQGIMAAALADSSDDD